MGTIEVSELLSYAVPLLVAYNAWLHRQVIKAQIDIAVNTAKDDDIMKQFEKFEKDIKAQMTLQGSKIEGLAKEIHEFLISQAAKNSN